jgi:TonB family protein
VKPVYPEALQLQGIEGTILLQAVIAKDGGLSALTVMNALANPELSKAAVDAVKQWRYEPSLLNGNPVEVATTITVNFKLR